MNDRIATLVKSLFQKESLHDCTVEELQTIARQYPYFSPAQFLLAEKLKSVNGDLYAEQTQKLSLYFDNPLWLKYLLDGYAEETTTEDEATNSFVDTLIAQPSEVGERPIEETVNATEADEAPAFASDEAESDEFTTVAVEEPVGLQRTNENSSSDESPLFAAPFSEVHTKVEEADNGMQASSGETAAPMIDDEQPGTVNENEQLPAEMPSDKDSDERKIPGNALDQLQQTAETELTFQPYHTVDYFASQGIKFVPEEKPADKFSQQLKSFTEWLKTLKRLPQTGATTDAGSEQKVQQLADHSIVEGEVVTETMADVWLKQGNKEKAIETYNKLSLLNPSKSAYFASRIEQVKNS